MSDLKPLGSERLQGDEKLKRIMEIANYGRTPKQTINRSSNVEYIKESTNGTYGIVKEKDGYYVKKGLNESSLDYIGGIFMKNKNKFSSYSEALKRLELISGQESLQEAKKYVLKTKSSEPVADEAPVEDVPAEPVDDLPVDDAPVDDLPPEDNAIGDVPAEEPEMGDEEVDGEIDEIMAKLESFVGDTVDEDSSEELEEKSIEDLADLSVQREEEIPEEEAIEEIDLEELKGEINKHVGETLSKYFK